MIALLIPDMISHARVSGDLRHSYINPIFHYFCDRLNELVIMGHELRRLHFTKKSLL